MTLDESMTELKVVVNSNSRNDAYHKVLVIWVNGTVDNPDGSRVMTGIKIPFVIDYTNNGPPYFSGDLTEITVNQG